MSRLELELAEQPSALARLLDRQTAHARGIAPLFRRDDVQYVLIASRGSSSNAARYAQYLLGRAHRVPVAFATPSLYTLYEQPPRLDGALVVGISQSGESPDVTAVVEEARRQGRPTIAITNDAASPLASVASAVLPLEAGDEQAVAATKTYLNSLGAVALLFAVSTDDDAALAELQAMPERVEAQVRLSLARPIVLEAEAGTVIARGINYATAFEIALKIRELSGLLFEAYSAADLMHGPVAAIAPGWPVLAIAPEGPARASMQSAISNLRDRRAYLIEVGPLVPNVPEWLSPLTCVIPGQVAALGLARARHRDVDRPQGLSKITLTR